MIIKPLIRDNIALNAHPEGCYENIVKQIQTLESKDKITDKPLNVLIIGGSSGYGLSSRIALAFNANAYTYNISFERGPKGRNTGSAGHYNNIAFQKLADAKGIPHDDLNADAFSHETKQTVIDHFKSLGKTIDLVIYSVASGIRIDPDTQEKYVSSLKPVVAPFTGYNVDIAKLQLSLETLDVATEEEIKNTTKVMGGEDYYLWAKALMESNSLSHGARIVTYTYIGSEATFPIYKEGTIGYAKRDLERANHEINTLIADIDGKAFISASKAVVTKASVFIPTMALYASALFKVMREKGTHESTIEHKYRLFKDMIYGNKAVMDEDGILRLDAYEMDQDTQDKVNALLETSTPENFVEHVDFQEFHHEFYAINGFDIEGVDYEADIEI